MAQITEAIIFIMVPRFYK